jgi:hypothetical protein
VREFGDFNFFSQVADEGVMIIRVPNIVTGLTFRLKGLKSKYLYFPTESHWVQSPQNSLVWQRSFFEWLKEDLKP